MRRRRRTRASSAMYSRGTGTGTGTSTKAKGRVGNEEVGLGSDPERRASGALAGTRGITGDRKYAPRLRVRLMKVCFGSQSSSSTESDSIPFANENAGTIKQNRNQMSGGGGGGGGSGGVGDSDVKSSRRHDGSEISTEAGDVLDDIGNMLANLTDELDAMLEEEKRQGLTEA